jgi:hypothetical protein
MGGSARKGDLMGMPWDAPPSMADTDVATVLTKAEALFVSLLLPAGRKGAAGEDTGPARSQGGDSGVAQQSPPMGAMSAAMPTIAAVFRQQQAAVPSQAIRKAAAAWPVRLKISSPVISRHMTGLRLN